MRTLKIWSFLKWNKIKKKYKSENKVSRNSGICNFSSSVWSFHSSSQMNKERKQILVQQKTRLLSWFCSEEHKRDEETRAWDTGWLREHS